LITNTKTDIIVYKEIILIAKVGGKHFLWKKERRRYLDLWSCWLENKKQRSFILQ